VCHKSCIIFGARSFTTEEIKGRSVLEVGSRDVNGSLRSIINAWAPERYVGVDIVNGPGVDVVCGAEDIADKFGNESFDVVISTEMVEHVKNWRKAISNIKRVCKPGGTVLLTTRSKGYGYHGYPFDFWRYETQDMKEIFSDFEILTLERDPEAPGVFLKARRPRRFLEADLSAYKLYSILSKQRLLWVGDEDLDGFSFLVLTMREKMKSAVFSTAKKILKRVSPGLYYG
jgi:SAM-dependent methyltransferase